MTSLSDASTPAWDFSRPPWTAPTEDGQLLIWPLPRQILADARANHQMLAGAQQIRLQKIPLPEVRRRQRQWISGGDDGQLLWFTGHQSELFHPGVWVKNVLINALARVGGGAAFHLAVDTDAPKHLHLRWPGFSQPISDDPGLLQAAWTGLLAAPTAQHVEGLAAQLHAAAANWSFQAAIDPFLDSLKALAGDALKLPAALATSIGTVESGFGLRHQMPLASALVSGEPCLLLVHHLLANAGAFAADYNAALDHYRRLHGIRAPGRPMPDLLLGPDEVETPFWLDDLSAGRRLRASVQRHANQWMLRLPRGQSFAFDSAAEGWRALEKFGPFLAENEVRLTPRALTLMLFLRLLVADHFVHGIGGGRYDQVTDYLMQRHFGLAAPRYGVTTATLYFPAAAGRARIDLHPLAQESRRLRHGLLSADKRRMALQIAELPRRSAQRRDLFFAMHARLAREFDSPILREAESRLRRAEQQRAVEPGVFDRELFFALQSHERLGDLVERYDKQVDAAR